MAECQLIRTIEQVIGIAEANLIRMRARSYVRLRSTRGSFPYLERKAGRLLVLFERLTPEPLVDANGRCQWMTRMKQFVWLVRQSRAIEDNRSTLLRITRERGNCLLPCVQGRDSR